MTRIIILVCLTATLCVSCATKTGPYQPATKPEKMEFTNDRLDVYPDDVRKDLAAHRGTPVVWAGIIQSSDATERDSGDRIQVDTTFEHHYFDWVQDKTGCDVKFDVSPRGEGLFRARWLLKKTDIWSSADVAEKFAGKGKLAIFYGIPKGIDTNGTIILDYHYVRILNRSEFTTNEYDYGRLGEPFRELHPKSKMDCAECKTAAATPKK